MLHGRKRFIAALTGVAAIVGVSLVPTTPTYADPDVDEVQARVDTLYHKAEVAQERYHDAKLQLDDLRADLRALEADQAAQQERVDRMQSAVDQAIAAQYEGEGLSATGQLVLSEDPDQFLSELTTLSAYNDVQAQVVDDYSREADALEIRREAARDRAKELAATEQALAEQKAVVEENLAEAKELLGDLKAEERAEMAAASRSSAPRLPANVPVSGRAAAAVNYALAQVGDAYVYGAAGPNAFDCSGLTMMAWAQAGVSLPHSSGAQQSSGARVSSDALQPGDLVFYYSPVSHVGIYIGGGRIVHAANPSTGVQVTGVFSMPYSGAVRPG
ncbi:C40 family peptidase [Nocardioides donggukensis]|uniref:C40 family peptidase n=1 Tax=Nocardioides donggukensis TaxID=2774019 RepID=A0A927PZH6_9ACTN|nr:C40 family peptidase [Nocardioides donggukensis]MBD8869145.1 C40 family peptidase [Nocardioides donggukensis]